MDRRRDDRTTLNIDCNIYLKEVGEIDCKVIDISEVGIAFEIEYNDRLYKKLNKGMKIKFLYLDEYLYANNEYFNIITSECILTRIAKKNNKMIVGCDLLIDNNIKKYIAQRKVVNFIEKMKSIM